MLFSSIQKGVALLRLQGRHYPRDLRAAQLGVWKAPERLVTVTRYVGAQKTIQGTVTTERAARCATARTSFAHYSLYNRSDARRSPLGFVNGLATMGLVAIAGTCFQQLNLKNYLQCVEARANIARVVCAHHKHSKMAKSATGSNDPMVFLPGEGLPRFPFASPGELQVLFPCGLLRSLQRNTDSDSVARLFLWRSLFLH